jgi:hypothetical protein
MLGLAPALGTQARVELDLELDLDLMNPSKM